MIQVLNLGLFVGDNTIPKRKCSYTQAMAFAANTLLVKQENSIS